MSNCRALYTGDLKGANNQFSMAEENVLYRGEGIQNLVLGCKKDKKVYRLMKIVQKHCRSELDEGLAEKERSRRIHLSLENNVDYIKNVMRPLLSDTYVIIPIIKEIPKGFAGKVEDEIQDIRPAYRKNAEGVPTVDPATCSALVLPDLCYVTDTASGSCISDTSKLAPSTISVEIKPKKGFITTSWSENENSSIKHQVCKFCMHQRLKAKEGRWNGTSHYCPIDLFSGNRQRMKHSLLALFHTPQNNLKICQDGEEVYSETKQGDIASVLNAFFGDDGGGLKNGVRKHQELDLLLDLVIDALLSVPNKTEVKSDHLLATTSSVLKDSANSNRSPTLRPLTCTCMPVQHCSQSSFPSGQNGRCDESYLPQNCVLERILSVQMLDTLDVNEIYSLYTKIKHHQDTHTEGRQRISLGSPYTSESWLQPCLESPINVNRDSIEYAASAVKRFTVSKTMQDCSIMLAMQRKTGQHSCEENKHQVLTDSHGRQYIFSVCIVDLDPKPVNKIRKYHEQRCEMSKAYQEAVADS